MAKEFGLSPRDVAEELDTDPERTALTCVQFLHYASAKAVWDSADAAAIKANRGKMMAEVEKNAMARAEREFEQAKRDS